MECTLAALIACFNLSGLYVDTGLSYQDSGVEIITARNDWAFFNGFKLISHEVTATHRARNPYGRLALGYQIEFKSVTWRIEASHVSSIETGKDRGVNAISVNARWFPFR